MRLIGLVVIALALISVSNQSQLSFGEFVGGHNKEEVRQFKITGSSDEKFNKLMPNRRLTVRIMGGKMLTFFGPAWECMQSAGQQKPLCGNRPCLAEEGYLHKFAYEVIFSKPATVVADFWSHPSSATFKFTAGSKWLTFAPLK